MTTWTTAPESPRVTRGGETCSARLWSMLEAAYRAAGLDPDTYLVVTHGSWDHYSGSGSTHDGGGAADLRTWNLPSSARANLCEALVVELRKRGGCAWYRDATHGGMDPHVHVILRDEPGLASGARSQVADYDAGRNGLSNKGPDYHPRPTQRPYAYPPTGTTPPSAPTLEGCAMFVAEVKYGSNGTTWWLVGPGGSSGLGSAINIGGDEASSWTGPRMKVNDEATWRRILARYPQ